MIHVGVLYADRRWEWRPSSDVASLPRDGVLFILCRSDDGNVFSLAHKDWYGLNIDGDVIQTMEVDDTDGRAFAYDTAAGTRQPFMPQSGGRDLIPDDFLIFEGQSVTAVEWEQALTAFQRETQYGRS